jgi:hypothetical protein
MVASQPPSLTVPETLELLCTTPAQIRLYEDNLRNAEECKWIDYDGFSTCMKRLNFYTEGVFDYPHNVDTTAAPPDLFLIDHVEPGQMVWPEHQSNRTLYNVVNSETGLGVTIVRNNLLEIKAPYKMVRLNLGTDAEFKERRSVLIILRHSGCVPTYDETIDSDLDEQIVTAFVSSIFAEPPALDDTMHLIDKSKSPGMFYYRKGLDEEIFMCSELDSGADLFERVKKSVIKLKASKNDHVICRFWHFLVLCIIQVQTKFVKGKSGTDAQKDAFKEACKEFCKSITSLNRYIMKYESHFSETWQIQSHHAAQVVQKKNELQQQRRVIQRLSKNERTETSVEAQVETQSLMISDFRNSFEDDMREIQERLDKLDDGEGVLDVLIRQSQGFNTQLLQAYTDMRTEQMSWKHRYDKAYKDYVGSATIHGIEYGKVLEFPDDVHARFFTIQNQYDKWFKKLQGISEASQLASFANTQLRQNLLEGTYQRNKMTDALILIHATVVSMKNKDHEYSTRYSEFLKDAASDPTLHQMIVTKLSKLQEASDKQTKYMYETQDQNFDRILDFSVSLEKNKGSANTMAQKLATIDSSLQGLQLVFEFFDVSGDLPSIVRNHVDMQLLQRDAPIGVDDPAIGGVATHPHYHAPALPGYSPVHPTFPHLHLSTISTIGLAVTQEHVQAVLLKMNQCILYDVYAHERVHGSQLKQKVSHRLVKRQRMKCTESLQAYIDLLTENAEEISDTSKISFALHKKIKGVESGYNQDRYELNNLEDDFKNHRENTRSIERMQFQRGKELVEAQGAHESIKIQYAADEQSAIEENAGIAERQSECETQIETMRTMRTAKLQDDTDTQEALSATAEQEYAKITPLELLFTAAIDAEQIAKTEVNNKIEASQIALQGLGEKRNKKVSIEARIELSKEKLAGFGEELVGCQQDLTNEQERFAQLHAPGEDEIQEDVDAEQEPVIVAKIETLTNRCTVLQDQIDALEETVKNDEDELGKATSTYDDIYETHRAELDLLEIAEEKHSTATAHKQSCLDDVNIAKELYNLSIEKSQKQVPITDASRNAVELIPYDIWRYRVDQNNDVSGIRNMYMRRLQESQEIAAATNRSTQEQALTEFSTSLEAATKQFEELDEEQTHYETQADETRITHMQAIASFTATIPSTETPEEKRAATQKQDDDELQEKNLLRKHHELDKARDTFYQSMGYEHDLIHTIQIELMSTDSLYKEALEASNLCRENIISFDEARQADYIAGELCQKASHLQGNLQKTSENIRDRVQTNTAERDLIQESIQKIQNEVALLEEEFNGIMSAEASAKEDMEIEERRNETLGSNATEEEIAGLENLTNIHSAAMREKDEFMDKISIKKEQSNGLMYKVGNLNEVHKGLTNELLTVYEKITEIGTHLGELRENHEQRKQALFSTRNLKCLFDDDLSMKNMAGNRFRSRITNFIGKLDRLHAETEMAENGLSGVNTSQGLPPDSIDWVDMKESHADSLDVLNGALQKSEDFERAVKKINEVRTAKDKCSVIRETSESAKGELRTAIAEMMESKSILQMSQNNLKVALQDLDQSSGEGVDSKLYDRNKEHVKILRGAVETQEKALQEATSKQLSSKIKQDNALLLLAQSVQDWESSYESSLEIQLSFYPTFVDDQERLHNQEKTRLEDKYDEVEGLRDIGEIVNEMYRLATDHELLKKAAHQKKEFDNSIKARQVEEEAEEAIEEETANRLTKKLHEARERLRKYSKYLEDNPAPAEDVAALAEESENVRIYDLAVSEAETAKEEQVRNRVASRSRRTEEEHVMRKNQDLIELRETQRILKLKSDYEAERAEEAEKAEAEAENQARILAADIARAHRIAMQEAEDALAAATAEAAVLAAAAAARAEAAAIEEEEVLQNAAREAERAAEREEEEERLATKEREEEAAKAAEKEAKEEAELAKARELEDARLLREEQEQTDNAANAAEKAAEKEALKEQARIAANAEEERTAAEALAAAKIAAQAEEERTAAEALAATNLAAQTEEERIAAEALAATNLAAQTEEERIAAEALAATNLAAKTEEERIAAEALAATNLAAQNNADRVAKLEAAKAKANETYENRIKAIEENMMEEPEKMKKHEKQKRDAKKGLKKQLEKAQHAFDNPIASHVTALYMAAECKEDFLVSYHKHLESVYTKSGMQDSGLQADLLSVPVSLASTVSVDCDESSHGLEGWMDLESRNDAVLQTLENIDNYLASRGH